MRTKGFEKSSILRLFLIIVWVIMSTNPNILMCEAGSSLIPTKVSSRNVTVHGMTGSFKVKAPLKPAEFEFSNLEITPKEVELGKSVTISVDVTNVGEEMGGCTVELKINGEVVDSVDIAAARAPAEVEPGNEVTISFVITNTDSRSYVFVPFVQIGETMIMEDVELEGHESRTVSYKITPGNVGDYKVTIDGLEGSFTVKPKPSFLDKIPGFPYESIIIGLIAVIIILWRSLVTFKR